MYPINYCAFCDLKMIRNDREICLYYDLSFDEWAKKCPYYPG